MMFRQSDPQSLETQVSLNTSCGCHNRLMLFDLSIYGHHPNYIKHLIKYWSKNNLPGKLDIVVSPKFLQVHPEVVDLASSDSTGMIKFTPIEKEEERSLKSRKSGRERTYRAFQEWRILRRYTNLLGSDHCLIMYFDTCEFPLITGQRLPCSFSGIYFRPTFHYSELTGSTISWKENLQKAREKFFLSRALSHPQLKTLFCLDPFATEYITQFRREVQILHLPDPVDLSNNLEVEVEVEVERLKQSLGIEPTRRIFLMFGSLSYRKGIYQLLDAILALPSEACQKICLLFVGEASPEEKSLLEARLVECVAKPVQVICHYEFIPDQEINYYFQLTDVVLAPYQRHVGMSGILLLAAAAQKPVLSSDYGLMGELVKRHSLGLAIDSSNPLEIADGLSQFLLNSPNELCDRTKMRVFAEMNSAEIYAGVIFQNL